MRILVFGVEVTTCSTKLVVFDEGHSIVKAPGVLKFPTHYVGSFLTKRPRLLTSGVRRRSARSDKGKDLRQCSEVKLLDEESYRGNNVRRIASFDRFGCSRVISLFLVLHSYFHHIMLYFKAPAPVRRASYISMLMPSLILMLR